MKIIRITTNNEITVHDHPEGMSYPEQRNFLSNLIGDNCHLEMVFPKRLYSVIGAYREPTLKIGSAACMLVDEDGLSKSLRKNLVGSWLYETDIHKHPIVGTVLIVGTTWFSEGIDYSGLSEEQFNLIYPRICNLSEIAKRESGEERFLEM